MNKPFQSDKKKRSGILGFICNDFLRKLFAVIIAILVMLQVKGTLDGENTPNIPNVRVKFELPEGIRFQSSVPPEFTATVSVKGKRSVVDNLKESDFEIVKKVSGKDGNVKITKADVTLKKRFFFRAPPTIESVSPDSFHLELDLIIQKDVPVNLVYDRNELPQGYRVEKVESPEDQKDVTVRGPSRIVSGLKKIDTERVPLDKATGKFTMDVRLIRPSDNVSLSFDSVPFTFNITGKVEKNILGVPVQLLMDQKSENGLSYSVEPATVTVNFEELAVEVGRTEKSQLHPYVLATGLKEGRTQCKVQWWCDKSDVEITSVSPEMVTVLVTKTAPEKPKPANGGTKK